MALESSALARWQALGGNNNMQTSRINDVGSMQNWLFPQTLTANILGATQQHLENTFQPVEDELMANLTWNNPGLMDDSVNSAIGTVNSAFDTAKKGALGNFQQYGIAPTQRQSEAMNSAENISRSSSIVDAATRIRTKMADRDRQIASGGLSGATQQINGG